ncbi:hypothetical protein H0H93_007247 [Arthromyces matolae]|nr:hypothetical protein H0H93_007247 [Arthromyces matolae]
MFQRDPRAGAFLGGDRVSGQDIRDQNVIAAQSIANIVKSSLGPLGLDKMLVDNIGEVTISNDGATILSLLAVEHPAGKIFVELAQKQDKEVGDGTTSVVIVAAELLRRANELVKAKIHPTTIITGYRLACREAVKFMQEQLSIKVDALGREALINVAKTTMSSKIIGNDDDLFAPMAVDAMLAVRTINLRGDIKYPVKAVNVLKAHGKSARESLFVQGYALNCTVASQAMKKRITNAKIACLDINLQKARMQLGVQILVDDPNQLEEIRKREAEITLERIRKILAAGANVVLTTKGIDDLCLKEFVEAGAMAVRRCRKEDLRRIAKATGGTLVSSLANLEGEESFEASYLGTAEEVVQERISDDELILVRGTKIVNSSSIILRGANDYMLDEMERALHDTLSVIKRTLESGAVVPGGGAVETALSIYLENFATTLGSREQLAIAEFAGALLSIPKTLAVNAAKDSTDLIAKLRSYHNAAQNAPAGDPKKALLRYGLDLINGEVRDNVTAGVLEPTMSKVKSLKSAYEAAISLLRIDDAIQCVPVWACLDADLTKTAVFHAERYYSLDKHGHDSRHLYATALLREGQIYSALFLVNQPSTNTCSGCLEIKSKCCTALGRHRQSREALEASLLDPNYVPSASTSQRVALPFPDEAALRCRSGNMALKGNLPEKATASFRQALALNPQIWEAIEGLCALGSMPDIDTLLPPRPLPVKRTAPDDIAGKLAPAASGTGLLNPDAGTSGNLTWRPDISQPQPFRIVPPLAPRDSVATNDSFYPDHSFHQAHRVTRSQPSNMGSLLTQASVHRPLSSADEAAPNPKRQRSTAPTTRQPEGIKKSVHNHKLSVDDPLKKARARPALIFSNIISSSGRRSQHTTSSRITGLGKSNPQPVSSNAPPRRSTRLHSGASAKLPSTHTNKTSTRGRRRPSTTTHSKSTESDAEDDVFSAGGEVAYSQSPPSNTPHSPRSEGSPSPSSWTAAHEQAAQEEYDAEMADYYLYNLTRKFATAAHALATYDCQGCLRELEQLPPVHQSSPWVLAMVGRAHFERQDFGSSERAFKAVRVLEPHRLWDMEVYSTLLWHLQRTVELSFLAQELLNIDPQSAQAWIAIGNLFSLQKERSQALTCFRRATQMDPTCAYAYTLSGHECIDEDLDKAIHFFQSALRADSRHYNAWYGLGSCYLRMSKLRLAEYHYRKAVEIHPNNAVLIGCVGMVSGVKFLRFSGSLSEIVLTVPDLFELQTVERRGDRAAALALYDTAVNLSADNALVRYRRAKIFISMRKYEVAVRDLEYLRSMTPEESNVVFQLAKVYRLLGNEEKSAQTLALARDISPKSLGKIKKLLETVKDEMGDNQMDEG